MPQLIKILIILCSFAKTATNLMHVANSFLVILEDVDLLILIFARFIKYFCSLLILVQKLDLFLLENFGVKSPILACYALD
jgi:hypothetical protein